MCSGTVASIEEGVRWLSYTYLHVRMTRNPLAYGVRWEEKAGDPSLIGRRTALIEEAASRLDEARMLRYDRK